MKKCWCGNENLEEYSKGYYKCSRCHTLISKHSFSDILYDVKNESEDLYGKNYWEVSMTKAAGKNTLSEVVDMYLSERAIYWLKYVLKYVKLGAKVAEVGCGLGQLQYLLRRCGYEQLAFELSSDICDYMKEQLGVSAHCGEFVADKDAYAGILAFDLFEHLMEPEKFLEDCAESLEHDGVLCFQTPCYDSELSYEHMMQKKPKFEEQLKAEQHIYLYSRAAITEILKKHGFMYIVFEPAFFGDDYDMFFVASRKPIHENTEKEIDAYLNSTINGRMAKALITLFNENGVLQNNYRRADLDRQERGKQVEILTQQLRESVEESTARMEQVDTLTHLLQESEADRLARAEQIDTLTQLLQESEADRAARLEQIIMLTKMVEEQRK